MSPLPLSRLVPPVPATVRAGTIGRSSLRIGAAVPALRRLDDPVANEGLDG